MDVRIAVVAGAVFLGVVASGFLMSSAEADFASAITAPFRESEDDHDDDDWDSGSVIRTGVDDIAVFGADARNSDDYGFAGEDRYEAHDDDDGYDDDGDHDEEHRDDDHDHDEDDD